MANYNQNSEFGILVTGNSGQKQTALEFIFHQNLLEFWKLDWKMEMTAFGTSDQKLECTTKSPLWHIPQQSTMMM